ncbi:ADP-ribosylglycohydrolase family protein [Georgenia sp. 10Sc9-8]|uniref:ADP-ribosylglycohydrolase family protein n=1 Tax=Georgenia halotolerans TaxID=3028317 RepID=A0ABT5TXY3_9MICO|nr:ADP-ribosylglycohydrolase family protein [Georgenia halotolerans]
MDAAAVDRVADRAHGCLLGVALGDALGMPTEGMAPGDLERRLGWVDDLLPGPGRALPAGQVTDDTEQTVMLAEAILAADGAVRAEGVTRHLLAWVDRAGPRADAVIGPSTARAFAQLRSGADPRTTGRSGTTNGAAMRITPVGLIHRPDDLLALVGAVEESCVMSHHTGVAISGASLVAGAVSAAVDLDVPGGGPAPDAVLDTLLDTAAHAARLGATRGIPVPAPDLAARADHARRIAERTDDDRTFLRRLHEEIGSSVATEESVPAAIGCLVRGGGMPFRVAVLAANLGADTDTVGAMAGGIAGALHGASGVPADLIARVLAVSSLDVQRLAVPLARLRLR